MSTAAHRHPASALGPKLSSWVACQKPSQGCFSFWRETVSKDRQHLMGINGEFCCGVEGRFQYHRLAPFGFFGFELKRA